MKRPVELRRLFSFSDGEMLEKASVIQECFTADLADFNNFDKDFNDAYLNKFKASLSAAKDVSSDNQIIDIMTQKTVVVEKLMDESRMAAQGAKYFIEKAFPNNPSKWNEFGYNDYEEARKSQLKMIQYLRILSKVCVKEAATLLAAGFTQEKIDNFLTLANNLDAANIDQQVYRKNRVKLTNERIKVLNDAWEMVTNICKVGKIIYENNYSHYQQYLTYEKSPASPPEPPIAPEEPTPEA